MKTMVQDLITNDRCESFFLIADVVQVRLSKKNTAYACMKLQDKTGQIKARIWDIPKDLDIQSLRPGEYVKVQAQVSEWQEQQQLSISKIRLAISKDGLDYRDFFEASKRDPQEMMDELQSLIWGHVDNDLVKTLLVNILTRYGTKFMQAPAAKSTHHNYLAGLLEHVLSMSQAAIPLCEHYGLRKHLVLAGVVLHDLGKIHELTYPIFGYSLEGTLLGHITMGMEMVADEIRAIEGFPQDMKIAILHLIASHHGQLQWGSAKVPLMREALVLHLVDMIDSKMAICARALAGDIGDTGLTGWVRELEGPIWRGPEEQ